MRSYRTGTQISIFVGGSQAVSSRRSQRILKCCNEELDVCDWNLGLARFFIYLDTSGKYLVGHRRYVSDSRSNSPNPRFWVSRQFLIFFKGFRSRPSVNRHNIYSCDPDSSNIFGNGVSTQSGIPFFVIAALWTFTLWTKTGLLPKTVDFPCSPGFTFTKYRSMRAAISDNANFYNQIRPEWGQEFMKNVSFQINKRLTCAKSNKITLCKQIELRYVYWNVLVVCR